MRQSEQNITKSILPYCAIGHHSNIKYRAILSHLLWLCIFLVSRSIKIENSRTGTWWKSLQSNYNKFEPQAENFQSSLLREEMNIFSMWQKHLPPSSIWKGIHNVYVNNSWRSPCHIFKLNLCLLSSSSSFIAFETTTTTTINKIHSYGGKK